MPAPTLQTANPTPQSGGQEGGEGRLRHKAACSPGPRPQSPQHSAALGGATGSLAAAMFSVRCSERKLQAPGIWKHVSGGRACPHLEGAGLAEPPLRPLPAPPKSPRCSPRIHVQGPPPTPAHQAAPPPSAAAGGAAAAPHQDLGSPKCR